jgi:glutathione S-transferase
MLTLYHSPISPNSRRVWITLLEKRLEFKLIEINLNGEQFQPDFLAINPFHHVPVLIDDGFKIVESLVILDYLEAKYPEPAMLPKDAKNLALARMAQVVAAHELLPAAIPLYPLFLGLPVPNSEKIEQAQQKVATVLQFLENLLDERPYFGSQSITLAEVVAGAAIPLLLKAGVSLSDYPKLSTWCDRLIARPSWQATEATPEVIEQVKSRMTQ